MPTRSHRGQEPCSLCLRLTKCSKIPSQRPFKSDSRWDEADGLAHNEGKKVVHCFHTDDWLLLCRVEHLRGDPQCPSGTRVCFLIGEELVGIAGASSRVNLSSLVASAPLLSTVFLPVLQGKPFGSDELTTLRTSLCVVHPSDFYKWFLRLSQFLLLCFEKACVSNTVTISQAPDVIR